MNHFFRTVVLFLLIFTSACGYNGPSSGDSDLGTTNRELFSRSFSSLLNKDRIGFPKEIREAEYFPENILPQLHGFFRVGKTLTRVSMGGHDALILTKFPDIVSNQLQGAAFGDDYHTGFAILQSAFWRRVSELMKEGFQIGFLIHDPSFAVNGMYFSDNKTILVDIISNEGVLVHEYRHHLQYLNANQQNNSAPVELSEKCLNQAIRFFGELDATTAEFSTWKGVFQTFDTSPAWHVNAHRDQQFSKESFTAPQMNLLTSNLLYPRTAAYWVLNEKTCPPELNDVILKTIAIVDEEYTDIYFNKIFGLIKLRSSDFVCHFSINYFCGSSSQPLSVSQIKSCQDHRDNLALIPEKTRKLKEEIDQAIENESIERPKKIRNVLNTLSAGIHQDLCNYSAGFAFMSDCPSK